jgi:PiT family inorganic phosphate transporter
VPEPLFALGIALACFVAFNVGGSTTGPAFGLAIGANAISKTTAGALMAICFFAGAFTLGWRVVDTLGRGLVEQSIFRLPVSIAVLFFIGGALLVGNVFGAPASTSMTAVGAIAGLGFATGSVDWAVLGEILAWWLLSPVIGFWLAAVVGRCFYPTVDRLVAIDRSPGPLLTLGRNGAVPRPVPGPNTTRRELWGTTAVVAIGCLMAFSSGTSNVANAVAPLVGSGELEMSPAIVIGSVAVAVGALTIARRTTETMGNDITDLPLTAAIVVAVISSSLVILLSAAKIPASFVLIATMCIVGLGWGRATRAITMADAVRGQSPQVSVGALTIDEGSPTVGEPELARDSPDRLAIGEEERAEVPAAAELFDPGTTLRVVGMQNLVPIAATVGSFVTFALVLTP